MFFMSLCDYVLFNPWMWSERTLWGHQSSKAMQLKLTYGKPKILEMWVEEDNFAERLKWHQHSPTRHLKDKSTYICTFIRLRGQCWNSIDICYSGVNTKCNWHTANENLTTTWRVYLLPSQLKSLRQNPLSRKDDWRIATSSQMTTLVRL